MNEEEVPVTEEELVENDEEPAREEFELVDDEEVIAYPSLAEDDECNYAVIKDLEAWIKKLEALLKYLNAELTRVRSYEEMKMVKYEILEVRRELDYSKWKLNKELTKCGGVGEALGTRPKGPKEPWLIVTLMRKYNLL